MNFIKNIIYSILSLQEKMLTHRLSKTLNARNSSKRKRYYGDGILLNIDSLADSEKQKMEEELALILKSYNYGPREILQYIKTHDTEVFYVNSAKSLISIGETIGFIYPQKGAKALYLSLLTEAKFKLKTKEMFILTEDDINQYNFIYHFYNWYAFKHGISGLDSKSQELLNKYLFDNSQEEMKKLNLDEIYTLKDAIKQDKSAIEFVFKLCRDCEGSKQALEKLKDNGANL